MALALAIASVIVYVLGIPIVGMLALFFKRRQLKVSKCQLPESSCHRLMRVASAAGRLGEPNVWAMGEFQG